MVFRKSRTPETQKPCARLREDDPTSASGDPAMVFKSKMASILPMVRAFYPLSPSCRIAAGHAARTFQSPRVDTRAKKCARELWLSDECCAFRAELCNAPRPCA